MAFALTPDRLPINQRLSPRLTVYDDPPETGALVLALVLVVVLVLACRASGYPVEVE